MPWLLALARGLLPVDFGLLATCGLVPPLDPLPHPLRALGGVTCETTRRVVRFQLTFVCGMLTFICDPFSLVGQGFALVGQGFAFVGQDFALIGQRFTAIIDARPRLAIVRPALAIGTSGHALRQFKELVFMPVGHRRVTQPMYFRRESPDVQSQLLQLIHRYNQSFEEPF
ncbi:MAG: hypothetical protein JO259_06245 [Mycobacterium sp.]|nr:hypothetical protein [Mycobacterium sp.]